MKEIIQTILEDGRIRAEKIASFGQASEDGFWYDQSEDEYAFVVRGEAVIEFCDKTASRLKSGQGILLKSHVKHRVAFTSDDCEWLCVFIKK